MLRRFRTTAAGLPKEEEYNQDFEGTEIQQNALKTTSRNGTIHRPKSQDLKAFQ